MTLFKPTLHVRRLKIKQGGSTAFDERFHQGVNIIRGHNSSGKTTVLDFLAHSLGSENIAWKPEALLCDNVFIEIHANGVPITLQRPVSEKALNPTQIFWGTLDDAD